MPTLNDFGISMEEAIERISIFAGKPSLRTNKNGSISLNTAKQMKLIHVWDKSELNRIKSHYGTLAYVVSINETYIGTPEGRWAPIIVADGVVKDNKDITNCRNCGAPVKGYKCEYCGTKY